MTYIHEMYFATKRLPFPVDVVSLNCLWRNRCLPCRWHCRTRVGIRQPETEAETEVALS